MIKPIALLLFILALGKFLEAADSNVHNTIDASNDIEGGLVDENVIHENVQSPNSGSYFDYFNTFVSYAYSAIFGSDLVLGGGSNITEISIAGATPLATSVSLFPSISNTINLSSGPITVSEALALIPDLQGHFEVFKSAWEVMKINKPVVAALKMRSLIPDYIIDDEDPEELALRDIRRSFNGPEDAIKDINFIKPFLKISVKKINFPEFNPVLDGCLRRILKKLPNESKAYVIDLIKNNSDSNGQKTLSEVVAEKEAEIVQALTNSVDSVRQLQAILRSNSQVSADTFNFATLSVVYFATNDIDEKFKRLRTLSETPNLLGMDSIAWSYEVALGIQKLAEILEVI